MDNLERILGERAKVIIASNFVFPVFFDNARYIQFGALFVFPFIALTSYAILKNRVFNVKIISTELFITVLLVLSLLQLIQSEALSEIFLRAGIFLSFIGIGILLINSVHKEVEQREELQKLNQTLREFLSFAAHDLKNPIALIKQLATVIYDKTYTDPKQIEETTKKIKTAADRAMRLIDDFLDLRSLESGQIKYNFEEKDIVEFVKNVAGDFKPLVEHKGLKFSVNIPTSSINTNIDTVKMRQVIQNLLDNALKYTNSGFIKVTVKEELGIKNYESGSILIEVEDSGLGIKKELLPTLFEQFHRDPGVERKIAGTGLGLYISRQFVLGHRGEIWAESDGEEKGSRFYVRLSKI